jgi:8-hydroxy-5-deazaflavin:NADPH oxidoreductase
MSRRRPLAILLQKVKARGQIMKIGIIGAGNIGSVLARKLTALKHEVRIANSRGPETLAGLAAATGAQAVNAKDAVKDVELVVITIPEKNVPLLPKDLFEGVPDSVIVVDTGNYYPTLRDGRIAELEQAPSESSWVSQKIGRPVIKVFNSIIAFSLNTEGKPPGAPRRLALPISGDDQQSKAVVMELVNQLGFDPIDAGNVEDSWRHEPGTPGYCTNLNAVELRKALSHVDRTRSKRLHKIMEEKFMHLAPNSSPDTLIKIVRDVQKAA